MIIMLNTITYQELSVRRSPTDQFPRDDEVPLLGFVRPRDQIFFFSDMLLLSQSVGGEADRAIHTLLVVFLAPA